MPQVMAQDRQRRLMSGGASLSGRQSIKPSAMSGADAPAESSPERGMRQGWKENVCTSVWQSWRSSPAPVLRCAAVWRSAYLNAKE